MLIWGKVLETIGSILVAYVGVRAFIYEIMIGRHYTIEPTGTDDLEKVGTRLSHLYDIRRRQFGSIEATAVFFGTLLIAAGCGLYLAGLLSEH